MRPVLFYTLLIFLGLVGCCAEPVDYYLGSCRMEVELRVYSLQEFPFDSIVNIENQKVLDENYRNNYNFSKDGFTTYFLALDPSRNQSSFSIYSSAGIDTLIIAHEFREKSSDCSGYWLEAVSKSVEKTTFQNPIIVEKGGCLMVEVSL